MKTNILENKELAYTADEPAEAQYAEKIVARIYENFFGENRNMLFLILGKVGSGKSYTAMSMAEIMDPDFSIDRVVFDENEFMNLMNDNTLKPGSFILCDEIGCWFGNREYMMLTNRMISHVLQTFRYKRLGLLWTIPQRRLVDINLRSLSDMIIETLNIWRDTKTCIVKMKYSVVNPLTGHELTPFPVISREGGPPITINTCLFPHPSDDIVVQYEKKKKVAMERMYEEYRMTMVNDKFKTAGRISQNIIDGVMHDYSIGKNYEEMCRKFRITENDIQTIVREAFGR